MEAKDSQTEAPLEYRYDFEFRNGSKKSFVIRLDPEELQIIAKPPADLPVWTALEFHKCGNCPLTDEVERCPIAINLIDLVKEFSQSKSFEPVRVTVHSPSRDYVKDTTLQKGISSLLGIYMTVSGCPIMDRLRPNVRFHLPFATGTETFFRSMSMHLMATMFAARRGEPVTMDMEELRLLYREVSEVNKGISARLNAAAQGDANVNALVILHTFGDGFQYYVDGNMEELEHDCLRYWPTAGPKPDSEGGKS